MTEAEFAKEVRSLTLSGIYFLYGDEDYLKNHYIRDACEKFVSLAPMASFTGLSSFCCCRYFATSRLPAPALLRRSWKAESFSR